MEQNYLIFQRHFYVKIINFEKVALISEDTKFLLKGSLYVSIASLGLSIQKINNYLSFNCGLFNNKILFFIKNVIKNNFVTYKINIGFQQNITIFPHNSLYDFKYDEPNKKYNFSKYSYIQKKNKKFVLCNPLSEFDIELEGYLSFNILKFMLEEDDFDIYYLIKNSPVCDYNIKILLSFLLKGNFIIEKENMKLKNWEFHDLLFHSSSRLGRSSDKYQFGATSRKKEIYFNNKKNYIDFVNLPKKDFQNDKVSFFQILQTRRSIREYGKNLITLQQLGDFLCESIAFQRSPYSEIYKPYPNAGSVHEFEFYIVCNLCQNLDRGIYYYDQNKHILCDVSKNKYNVDQIVRTAQVALNNPNSNLQILIIITSNFSKMSDKYEGIAYRNTLINVGAVFQTMYLVATALKLAPCALGYGNTKFFGEATDLNYLEEGSVGEFALGAL